MKQSLRRTAFAAYLMALGLVLYVAYKFANLSNWDLFWLIAIYG